MLPVFLSPLAEKKLVILLDYLEEKWSIRVRNNFLEKFKSKTELVSMQPKSCPESQNFSNLYKCTVTKQVSFYYRIYSDEIEIITIFDNRQNPNKLQKEI